VANPQLQGLSQGLPPSFRLWGAASRPPRRRASRPSECGHLCQHRALGHPAFRYPALSAPCREISASPFPLAAWSPSSGPTAPGKSTFIKLLCRFFDPQQGSIGLDGTDLRQFSLDELRSRITVSSSRSRCATTPRSREHRPGRSEPPRAPDRGPTSRRSRRSRVRRRRPAGGIRQPARPALPGWRRAKRRRMAAHRTGRAVYRRAPILILDEPTSAMDAWAEAD